MHTQHTNISDNSVDKLSTKKHIREKCPIDKLRNIAAMRNSGKKHRKGHDEPMKTVYGFHVNDHHNDHNHQCSNKIVDK